MELVSNVSIARGAAYVDYAFSNHGENIDLSVSDSVAIVAASIARGVYSCRLENELAARLHPAMARDCMRTFELFDDYRGRGLWVQGPAMDDIKFTHPLLVAAYPDVNEAHRRMMRSFGSGLDE